MYVFSNSSTNAAVLNSIDNFNIQARITGTVNGISFTDANIVGGSFSITNQCSSETELSIGQVYVGELNITLTGLAIDRYSLYGKQIIPTWGIYVNSAWRNVPLGTFIISEVEVVSLGLRIRAYDNMSLFDVPFIMASLGGQPRALALAACTACGVTLGTNATTFATFPNYNVTLNATQTSDIDGNKSIPEISTYRDVIHYIAQVTCTNATIDRSGRLIFVPYPSTAVASIDTSHRKMGGMTADFETYYDGIIVTDPATKAQTKYTRSNPSGLTMDLGDNPFINTAAIRNAILNALTFRFHPFRMDILNAPLYDLMDCINLPDGIGDGTKLYCITKYTWTYHGSYQLVGAGQDPKLVAVTSAVQRSAAQAAFIAAQKVTSAEMDAAIDSATAQITGNNGGYVVLHDSDNDDQPDELLVMNTPSINTATKVWRFNLSGLGHSNNGYSGTYGLALTADGNIVANKVVVGTLGDLAGKNWWNMETGDISISASGNIDTITTYYAESYENEPPQWDAPKAYLFDANGDALFDANGDRLIAKSVWTTTRPTTVSSLYRWMRQYIVYTDGSTTLTDAAPMQDYYGRANLVMELSKDSSGAPIGTMSGIADYIRFTAGQLEITSPQFTLDREGNATFAGDVVAKSLTLGSSNTPGAFRLLSPDGYTDVNLSGDSSGSYISVTDTTSYARATLRGQAGSLILSLSSDSGATYTELGSLWVNAGTGRSVANIDTIQVGRFQAAPSGLRGNQVVASWNYTTNMSTLSANNIQVINPETASYYNVLSWDSSASTPGTKISTAYGTIGELISTKITENSLWGSNGEVIHYTATGGNILRAFEYQVGTESDHATAITYSSSAIDIRANMFKLRNSGTLYTVLSWDSTNSGTKVSTSYGSIGDLTSTKITEGSLWGSNGEVVHYINSSNNNVVRSYVYSIGNEADHKTFGNYSSGTAVFNLDQLYLGGGSTAVGTVKTATSSATSLPSGTTTNIVSVSLTKGTWVVSAQFSMPVASSDSFRLITSITTTSGDYGYTAAYNNQACVGSAQTVAAVSPTRILEVTTASQTVYLTANQNSGSSKTLTASRNVIRAVCIA